MVAVWGWPNFIVSASQSVQLVGTGTLDTTQKDWHTAISPTKPAKIKNKKDPSNSSCTSTQVSFTHGLSLLQEAELHSMSLLCICYTVAVSIVTVILWIAIAEKLYTTMRHSYHHIQLLYCIFTILLTEHWLQRSSLMHHGSPVVCMQH